MKTLFGGFSIALFLGAVPAGSAWSNGLEALENFLKNTHSGQASFSQSVTSPSKAGEAARVKNSSGSFEFSRPNRFRFHYTKPFEQLILADGASLWIYDADLNQASQRKQADVFANTPAALIASSADLSALRRAFKLESEPEQSGADTGLSWVLATPKSSDSTLQRIRIGLRSGNLAQLDITDSFGQRSQIRFENMQLNPSLPADKFKFVLPKDAQLLKQ